MKIQSRSREASKGCHLAIDVTNANGDEENKTGKNPDQKYLQRGTDPSITKPKQEHGTVAEAQRTPSRPDWDLRRRRSAETKDGDENERRRFQVRARDGGRWRRGGGLREAQRTPSPPDCNLRREALGAQRGNEGRRQHEKSFVIYLFFLSKLRTCFFINNNCETTNMASLAQVSEGEARPPAPAPERVVLTPPLSLEGGLAAEHRAPNIVQRLLSLFKDLRAGSDLTHFQLPPLFNMPKSQLQCYGEAVYCVAEDMVGRCAGGKSSLERFASVVAWSISTTRPPMFALAPYNPILGETHHVSRGTLNVLLEQVSHHPPVAALHATDTEKNVELLWCQNPVPRFTGTSIETLIHGKRQVKLLGFGECYEMDAPGLSINLFPVPSTEWTGNVSISCKESGLEADLCYYKSHSFFGFGPFGSNPRSVKGKIFHSKTLMTVYEIYGQWDRTVMLKDVHSGKVTVLYNAKDTISKLRTPTLKDPEGLLPTESAMVWAEISQGILKRDWEGAREAKKCIEDRERNLQAERSARGETWVPRYFKLEQNKDGGWECWPKLQAVPTAPIVVPC